MNKIRVENLGVITNGKLEINKSLTIFTGPNNSGKSYMAYLVYGYSKLRINSWPNNDLFLKYKSAITNIFQEEDVFEDYFTNHGINLNLDDFSKKYYNDIHSSISKNLLEDNASEIFATNLNYHVFIEIQDNLTTKYVNNETFELNGTQYHKVPAENSFICQKNSLLSESEKRDLKEYIASKFNYNERPFFFPAERSAIHLFSKEIFKQKAVQRDELAKVIQNGNDIENAIKTFQENGTLIPRYPLAINDYLAFTSDFEYFSKQPKTEFEDLAKELETILEGRISVNSYGSLEFKPKGTRKNLPLHLSSSMVKSLGGLVIYLRHLARKHDHIIIDEPELNLHPSTQVRLARLLAKIANRGIKLLISTHSDYIISELSNLILLSDDFKGKAALQKKYRYKKDDFIKADDVNVYAFQNETIEQVPITEQGIEIDKIRKVIADMNLRSDDIYYIHLDSLEDAPI